MSANEPTLAAPSTTAPGRRRAAPGKRWSAVSTVEWLAADRTTLARHPDPSNRPAGAVKARVHYRLDGIPKRPTFRVATAAELDDLRAFVATLAIAYHHDWPADASGKPVAPTALPKVSSTTAPVAPSPESPAAAPVALGDLLANSSTRVLDAPRLVTLFQQHQRTSKKKRGGGTKARNTQSNYDSTHEFFLDHARYKAGDPRLDVLGLEAGASWVFDNPAAPIVASDLLGLISIRSVTNLRTRGVNERRMAKWKAAVGQARATGSTVIPTLPELLPEECAARTVEAFSQQLGAMLTFAHNYGHLPVLLWTQQVKDEVPHAVATSYTTRTVPSRQQVSELVTGMRNHSRWMRCRDGVSKEVFGDRYAALVWVAGRMAPRPEEQIAIRDSWVDLNPEDPRIVLRHAEIIQPALDGKPRERVVVPLKHRAPDQVRVLRPDPADRAEFIEVMSRHRRDHIDPNGDPDQYFFTTHTGAPLDLSNWNDDWWKPVRDEVFSSDTYLADMPFRRLRAAAITDWLFELGWSTGEAADMAGNSQPVLEKHYKGVIDEGSPTGSRPRRVAVAEPTLVLDPVQMTSAQIAERKQALVFALEAARAEFAKLQEAESAQFNLEIGA